MLDFRPIPGLFNPDADLSITFLSSNGMPYIQRTLDPWYRATRPGPGMQSRGFGEPVPSYLQDEAASPLACLEQIQLCATGMPADPPCSKLGPYGDLPANTNAAIGTDANGNVNNDVLDRIKWFHAILMTPSQTMVEGMLRTLMSEALTSRDKILYGAQGAIADNQWQLDTQLWFSAILASTQAAFVQALLPAPDPRLEATRVTEEDEQIQAMCQSQVRAPLPLSHAHPYATLKLGLSLTHTWQKIRSTAYSSFSIFGLAFIAGLGGLIVIVSYTLEAMLACLVRRGRLAPATSYAFREWTTNSTLQLQRLAHQGAGIGSWSGGTDIVPVTYPGEKLAVLDLDDPQLPQFVRVADGVDFQLLSPSPSPSPPPQQREQNKTKPHIVYVS